MSEADARRGAAASQGRFPVGWWVLVFAVAVAAHGVALDGAFLYDDVHAVRDNPAIRSLAAIPSYFVDPTAFSAHESVMYRPVVSVTLAISYAIGGGHHAGFAALDLLLHGINALLLVAVALRLGVPCRGALLAASLYAVHPLTSLGVHLASARSDQLVLTGALLAIVGQVRAVRGGSRSRVFGGVALGAFGVAIACGSKESGAVLPLALLAVEWALRDSSQGGWSGWSRAGLRASVLRLLPASGVVVGYLVVRKLLLGMATAAPMLTAPAGATELDLQVGHGRDLVAQFATMGELLPRALLQVIAPLWLSLDPPVRFLHDPATWTSLAGWAAVAVLFVVAVRHRRRPYVAVGSALVVGLCAPWVIIPLNAPLTENRLYGPLAGLALIVAPSLARWTRSARFGGVGRVPGVAAGCVCLLLAALSVDRGLELADPPRAWQAVLRFNPGSERAWRSLAQLEIDRANRLRAAGRADESLAVAQQAAAMLERAVALHPASMMARRGIVELRCSMGPEARGAMRVVHHAEQNRERYPTAPFRRINLAKAYQLAGQVTGDPQWFDRGVEAALSTLDVAPARGLVYRTAAGVRAAQENYPAAVALLDRGYESGFRDAGLIAQRGLYRLENGDVAGARQDAAAALRVDPFQPAAAAVMRRLSAARPPR